MAYRLDLVSVPQWGLINLTVYICIYVDLIQSNSFRPHLGII